MASDKLITHLEYIEKLESKSNPDTERKKFLGLGKLHDISFRNEDQNAKNYYVSGMPSAIGAIEYAYTNHLHLSLSPSDFIILIGQGLANHINMNPEKLRHNFVDHQGKKNIVIMTNKVSMQVQSDWSPLIDEFSLLVKEKIKKNVYDVVIDDTGTATKTTRVVSELNLMDCMKNYFNYVVIVGCGLPQISLRGKPEDWQKLKDKVYALKEMNSKNCLELDWWLQYLVPIVDKICEAGIDRKIDHAFWANIYKDYKVYGTVLTGWINAFLPYYYSKTMGFQKNFKFGEMRDDFTFRPGVNTADICEGLSSVPFLIVDYDGEKYDMHFYSGFLGTKYDEKNNCVQPEYFWSVFEDPKNES